MLDRNLSKIMIGLLVCYCLLIGSTQAYAANYHLSTIGSNSTGDGSLGNPWRTPEYGATQLQPGDTLNIHEGTYYVNGTSHDKGAILPAHGGSSENTRVIIKNYEDDTVIIDGGSAPTEAILGTWYGIDYITFKGLIIKGLVVLEGTKNSIIEDCDISVGGETGEGMHFGCVLWIENTENCTVRNCYIHDNNYQPGSGNDLVYEYNTTNLIFENNEVYNSVAAGLALKDNPETIYVRYNIFRDINLSGIWCANQDDGHNIYIYQNIFRNCNKSNKQEKAAVKTLIDAKNIQIYNNVFDNNKGMDIFVPCSKVTWSAWNNIHINSEQYFLMIRTDWSASLDDVDYLDHNSYYAPSKWYDGTTRSTLSDWRSATGFDTNSLDFNPQFVDPTNHDYHLKDGSPCKNGGRGGSFATVMGVYISGVETIGPLDNNVVQVPSPPPTLEIIK